MFVLKKKLIVEYLLVVIGLTALTFAIFRELFPFFSSAIIGDKGDGAAFLWNFWWVKKSILELHQNPIFSDYMFFSNVMDLRLHTLILAPAVIMLPIQILWGSIAALNIYVLGSFVLAGLGAYMLVKIYVKSRPAAFLGAIIFAFNAYAISHSYGHFNLITTWPIPFVIYFLEKMHRTGKTRYALLASLAYIFLLYSDLQYAIFTSLFIGLWAIWKIAIIAIGDKKLIFFFVKPLLVFFIFIVIGSYPLYSLVSSGMNNDLTRPRDEAAEFYSPDILAYVIPPQGTITNKIAAGYDPDLAKVSFSGPEWAVYLGMAVIILLPFIILRLIWKRENEYVFWVIAFIVFFILSLGPELHYFARDTGIVLPFTYIHNWPLFNMTRVPARIIIIAMLAISVLVPWLLSGIKSAKFRCAAVLIFGAIYVGELFLLPVYIRKLEMPEAYIFLERQPSSDKANGSIIEFPLFFSDRIDRLGKVETTFFYYQTEHEYKLVNGYLSYSPPGFLKQYAEIPGMLFLVEPANYGRPQEKDLEALKVFLFDKTNVKYGILHKNILQPAEYENLSEFFKLSLNAEEVYGDSEIVIYKMR